MKSVRHIFADITAALEYMHGIAVEGQANGLSPDIHIALLRQLRAGAANLDTIMVAAALKLAGDRP